jgi:glycosyltransferase involved in cell wall biosynthesis
VRNVVVEHEWCPPERIELIPNGVALPASEAPSAVNDAAVIPSAQTENRRADGPLVGMVGRLSWKKGYEHALDAAALLREHVPAVRFEIVGDGPLRGALEQQTANLGLEATVRFLGQRRDVPDLMRRFDCFVLSSVIEGMPNALLEAMALGLPVVTTSAGGSAEVVVDGESGFVVPPADPTALAGAIERVLADRALARRLGEQAARRVHERFSLAAMLGAIDALYRKELARAGIRLPTIEHEAAGPDRASLA